MELEKLFNQQFLYDLSFFNFENAITATYFADTDLNIIKVNKNFKSLFNDDVVLEGQNLLTLLGLLDVAQSHISEFKQKLNKDGKLLIHKIKIIVGDEGRYFTLASTRTSSSFSNGLFGVQGQLIDRTNEVTLQARNEELLVENEKAFEETVNQIIERSKKYKVDKIAAIESRGFVFASAVSYLLKKPFIMLRKKNKLPADVHSVDFELEYGTATIEVHKDSINEKDNVLIIDDLIATGGTAEAAAELVEISKGKVAAFIFVINLFDLGGCEKLIKNNYRVENLIEFPGH